MESCIQSAAKTQSASAEANPGLTTAEAVNALARYGPNETAPRARHAGPASFLLLFLNPLVLILLLAAAVSGFLGQIVEASIITTIVFLGIIINFFQTHRSTIAADKLRQQVLPTATVRRDSCWVEILQRLVVPDDVIRLSAGDLVPADALVVEANDLHIQQAALTGESFPVEKQPLADAAPGDDPDSPWMLFLGTSVVSGTGTARIVATGAQTVFGDIAKRLSLRPEETEFERGIRNFGGLILQTVLFLVLFLMVVSIALRRDALQSLLFAVSLAVGLTPEFLPMITSVTLARAAVLMARKKVIVKHLASIQNLGSIDILCSDKTGTLTEGVMTLDRAVDFCGNQSPHVLNLAWLNAFHDTGIRSPLDTAILDRGSVCGDDCYIKLDEIPFDFERRRVSIVLQQGQSQLLIAKGAPESILAICKRCETCAGEISLDEKTGDLCRRTFEEMGNQGLRVLAVASKSVGRRQSYGKDEESELCLAGFVAFLDPPRVDAGDLLATLGRDGVGFRVITGDNERVTRYICERVGLPCESIVLGDEIEAMTDPALGHIAEEVNVFARVSPAQKNRIILALKHRGHVVGYIGDGINDAPSLHAADVGISVSTAVDVARDAAQIILTEPGLDVVHTGIIEGRKAFGNVMKYVLMGTSSNFGNVLSMAVASLVLPFLPMLPAQILLNNFLYDIAQITIPSDRVDDSWVRSPQRWNISSVRKFMLALGPISSVYDFLTFYVLLHFLHSGESLFHTGWFVESLATQTLVLFVIRTTGSPLRSRPSLPLAATILIVIAIGLVMPFLPFAGNFGFTPLPALYFVFLAVAASTYLVLAEIAKRFVFNSHLT